MGRRREEAQAFFVAELFERGDDRHLHRITLPAVVR
jgi:hypothetical protein